MTAEQKIEYNGAAYSICIERDISGAGSMRDLAEDFAYDIVERLGLSCESKSFDIALQIIEDAFYDLMKYSVLPVFPKPPKKPRLEFPPKHKETEAWQVN